MKILFVIPQLDLSGSAKQLRLLAENLPRERFECRICVLGAEATNAEPLRKAGVGVETLGWRRWLDLSALGRLRRSVRDFRPDLVHAWRPTALRAIAAGGLGKARLVMSAPLAAPDRRAAMGRLDRWLFRRVERVIVRGPAQAERCKRGGIQAEKLVAIPPAVAVVPPGEMRTLPLELAGLDPKVRCLACVGPFQAYKGFRDAIWAFDILRYVEEALHLFLLGDGPDRPRLRQFVRDSRTTDCVHMPGTRDDVAAWLARAQLAWVPSRAPAGVHAALEAMAAGRPVVASNWPELAEVVLDGQTGFLIPPGDKVALARHTRDLLHSSEQRRQLGDAGRQRAARHFAVADLVRRFADLYENPRGIS